MEKILELLSSLAEADNIELDDTKLRKFADELKTVYSSDTFRHSYAEISRYLEAFSSDQRDIIAANVDEILFFSSSRQERYPETMTYKIGKLADHVDLECLRLNRMDEVRMTRADLYEQSRVVADEFRNVKVKTAGIEDQVKNLFAQIISIVGIFTGIVVAFSVITQLSVESFSNLNDTNLFRLLLFVIILGLIMFDIIFLLMYSVAKLTKANLAVVCKYGDCQDCNRSCNYFTKAFRRYPYVAVVNSFMLLAVGVLILVILKFT